MSTFTKPTQIPIWASDDVNNVEPSLAKRQLGWLFEEVPPSSNENWLRNLAGTWFEWLDERIEDGVNTDEIRFLDPVAGDEMLEISALHLKWYSAAGVAGFEFLPGGLILGVSAANGISLSATGNDKSILFDATTDGIYYDVALSSMSIFVGAAPSVELAPSLVTVKELAVFEKDVSAPDYLLTSNRIRRTGPTSWHGEVGGGGAIEVIGGDLFFRNLTAADASWQSLVVDKGDRITNIQVYCQQGAVGTLTVSLHSVSSSGVVSAAIGSASTANVSTWTGLLISGLTETVVNDSYVVKVESDGAGLIDMTTCDLYYDRPVG